MPLQVVLAASIVDDQVIFSDRFEASSGQVRMGNLVGLLTALDASPSNDGPTFTFLINISDGPQRQTMPMTVERFLSGAEFERSQSEPLSISRVETVRAKDPESAEPELFWLFKNHFYAALRVPGRTEHEEVILRIKALHFQGAESLKRLREQVANFEAIEGTSSTRTARSPLSDDVKLLVWARDGARCVKCNGAKELHFDHIIPLCKGGGDHAENIQLLCRNCNLSKGDRLT